MTQQEAIDMVAKKNVWNVESENCELTCRVGGNGVMHNDPYLEYSASVCVDYSDLTDDQKNNLPIDGCKLTVYYRVPNDLEKYAIDSDVSIWDVCYNIPSTYEIE